MIWLLLILVAFCVIALVAKVLNNAESKRKAQEIEIKRKAQESLRNNEMIQDIAKKLAEICRKCVPSDIDNCDSNGVHTTSWSFFVFDDGICYDGGGATRTDMGYRDIRYKDYGYSSVNDSNKEKEMAKVLQDLVIKQLGFVHPALKMIRAGNVDTYYGPFLSFCGSMRVCIDFDFTTNQYKEL